MAGGRLLLSHSASIKVSMTCDESHSSTPKGASAGLFAGISSSRPTSVPVETPVIDKMCS